jgi:hypothetical protein
MVYGVLGLPSHHVFMTNKDVVYLWSACAQCTCGRLIAPHPVEARRLGIPQDDVMTCGECGVRVMNWLSDQEVEAFVRAIEESGL